MTLLNQFCNSDNGLSSPQKYELTDIFNENQEMNEIKDEEKKESTLK